MGTYWDDTDWSSTKARRLLIRHYICNGTYISDEVRRNRDRAKQRSFAGRFALRLGEFGSCYWLAKASGIPESTLQQYERQVLPPRSEILIKLARATLFATLKN